LNYYYFGYVLVAALVHLTGTLPEIAFNLALPSFFAFAVAAVFSASSGLGLGLRRQRGETTGSSSGLGYGALGCLFVLVLGNLGTARLLLSRWFGSVGSFPIGQWFWAPSRVIGHPIGEAEPITEFPAFSFLFGDLHAHLMALPYAIALLALVVARVRWTGDERVAGRWAVLGWLALLVGFLGAANTWDVPLGLALVGIGLAASQGPILSGVRSRVLVTLFGVGSVGVLGYLLYLPFHLRWARGYGGVTLWGGSSTSLLDYLTAHGLFLSLGVLFLLWGRTRRERQGLARVARLLFDPRTPLRKTRRRLGSVLGSASRVDGVMVLVVGGVALLGALAGLGHPALAVGLAVGVLLLARCHGQLVPVEVVFYGILALGGALTVVPEIVVLKNDVGRMNTVFKLGFEAWWLLGIAGAVAVVELLRRARRRGARIRSSWIVAVLLLGLLYPIVAVPDRIRDRFAGSSYRGLNGLAYLEEATYSDPRGAPILLRWDLEAIEWLRREVEGTPVIAESPELEYGWGSRISSATGLPTVVGWIAHQRQQRIAVGLDLAGQRARDLARLYRTTDLHEAARLLDRYDIEFLILGRLERLSYPGAGLEKFEEAGPLWTVAFANRETKILHIDLEKARGWGHRTRNSGPPRVSTSTSTGTGTSDSARD
ncbi:MAG: DUF2298 domain-containing protein, partial [Thermoanaerobaculia bacterium]|nr:DUF2298 domain-containing protein [Thermoanaerobaculia bacterium]